ncbi:hypothetical protein ACFL5K_02600 [Gemmatimonadota bacterium]
MSLFFRKIAVAGLTFLALSLPVTLQGAGSSVTAGAFVPYQVSVRGVGMGGAYVGLAQGGGAPYHNPAAMGFAEQRFTSISYGDLGSMGLVRNVYLDYLQPDNGYGASGIYWNWRGTEVEGPGGKGKLGYSENTFCYALAKRLGDYVSVAAAVKGYFIVTDIDDAGGKGGGLDLAVYAAPDPFSTVGVVVRNALSTFSWDTGLSDNLPLELEIGGSYLVLDELIVAADLRFEKNHYTGFSLGGEYKVVPELFMVRAGFTRRFDRTSPAFGLGFIHEIFAFDYAAEIDAGSSGLGTTHRVGFMLEF